MKAVIGLFAAIWPYKNSLSRIIGKCVARGPSTLEDAKSAKPVSYTHLTLPTNREV